MAEAPFISDASQYFTGGVDSYTLPAALSASEYVAAMNVVNRGGIIQTRPGSLSRLMVGGVKFQGLTGFVPSSGVAHLVYALDGYIYVSQAPFTSWRKLPNIKFNQASKFVSFESCLKSTDYTDEGVLYSLPRPYKVLIMQDGSTRAAYWDGGQSGHLNPTPSGTSNTQKGFDETFIGLWMKWSGNRLWVARGPLVFASDAGNPMKFTEAQYINEGRAFYLPDSCTGMVETPDRKGLIAFTEDQGIVFQTNIQDRTKWLQTPEFQSTCFQNVGCVAPLSIVTHNGLIWWFSHTGLVNSDQALALNVSSKIDHQDNEMACSKAFLGPNLTAICSVSYENYLLVSVPSGSNRNRHTWCLDQAVFEGGGNSWGSYWTGWNPVQWATLKVDGEKRVFFASADNDGCNRIWEAFQSDRTDNGRHILCSVQLREHSFAAEGVSARDMKKFRFARIFAQEMLSSVALVVAVAGTRGGWRVICRKDLVATKGGVYANFLYDKDTCMYGHRPQARVIDTQEDVPVDACNQGGVESDLPNNIDRAFTLLITWSGRMGFAAVELYASLEQQKIAGKCEPDEAGPRSLSEVGCAAISEFVTGCPFEKFTSTQTGALICRKTNILIEKTVTATSYISQKDADRRALGLALVQSARACACSPPATGGDEPPQENQPPVVTVPTDQVVYLFDDNYTLDLEGSVTDDGLPEDGALSSIWTLVSGPASVAFADDAAPGTQATFFEVGTYVLRLGANDGQYYVFADVTIEVRPVGFSLNNSIGYYGEPELAGRNLGNSPDFGVHALVWVRTGDNTRQLVLDVPPSILASTVHVDLTAAFHDPAFRELPGVSREIFITLWKDTESTERPVGTGIGPYNIASGQVEDWALGTPSSLPGDHTIDFPPEHGSIELVDGPTQLQSIIIPDYTKFGGEFLALAPQQIALYRFITGNSSDDLAASLPGGVTARDLAMWRYDGGTSRTLVARWTNAELQVMKLRNYIEIAETIRGLHGTNQKFFFTWLGEWIYLPPKWEYEGFYPLEGSGYTVETVFPQPAFDDYDGHTQQWGGTLRLVVIEDLDNITTSLIIKFRDDTIIDG